MARLKDYYIVMIENALEVKRMSLVVKDMSFVGQFTLNKMQLYKQLLQE